MSKRLFKVPIDVHLLILKENHVLLLKRQNTGFMDGYYCLPVGKHDGEESLTHAIIREAKEEVGITLLLKDTALCTVIHHCAPNWEGVNFFFICKDYEGELTNAEPDKCEKIDFFSIDHLPENTLSIVKEAIKNYKDNISYSEFGW